MLKLELNYSKSMHTGTKLKEESSLNKEESIKKIARQAIASLGSTVPNGGGWMGGDFYLEWAKSYDDDRILNECAKVLRIILFQNIAKQNFGPINSASNRFFSKAYSRDGNDYAYQLCDPLMHQHLTLETEKYVDQHKEMFLDSAREELVKAQDEADKYKTPFVTTDNYMSHFSSINVNVIKVTTSSKEDTQQARMHL